MGREAAGRQLEIDWTGATSSREKRRRRSCIAAFASIARQCWILGDRCSTSGTRISIWMSCCLVPSAARPAAHAECVECGHEGAAHDSHQAFEKLCRVLDGEPRFVHDPPLVVPVDPYVGGVRRGCWSPRRSTRSSSRTAARWRRIGGICWSATGSCISPARWSELAAWGQRPGSCCSSTRSSAPRYCYRSRRLTHPCSSGSPPKSKFSNHGRRVVAGQRLMQAASDIFLGWERFSCGGDRSATTTSASCATGRARPTSRA